MTRLRLRRISWIGAAAILVVAALIGLAAIVRGRFNDTDARIVLTLVALLLAGGTSLAGLALRERAPASRGSRTALVTGPACFGLILYSIWAFQEVDGGHATQVGWSAVIVLVAALLATSARLLVSGLPAARLATACAALATAASLATVFAIWWHHSGSGFGKLIAALWILTALAFFLAPVSQRWAPVDDHENGQRVLASLGDVELIATRTLDGGVVVDDSKLARGERLVLRERSD